MVSDSFDLGNIRLLDRGREMLEVVAGRGYHHPENLLGHRALGADDGKPAVKIRRASF